MHWSSGDDLGLQVSVDFSGAQCGDNLLSKFYNWTDGRSLLVPWVTDAFVADAASKVWFVVENRRKCVKGSAACYRGVLDAPLERFGLLICSGEPCVGLSISPLAAYCQGPRTFLTSGTK